MVAAFAVAAVAAAAAVATMAAAAVVHLLDLVLSVEDIVLRSVLFLCTYDKRYVLVPQEQ